MESTLYSPIVKAYGLDATKTDEVIKNLEVLEIKEPDIDLVDTEREALLHRTKVLQAVMMMSKLPKREIKLCNSLEVKNFFGAGHFFDRYYKQYGISPEDNECRSNMSDFCRLRRLAGITKDVIVDAFPLKCPRQFLDTAESILNWCTLNCRSQGITDDNLVNANEILEDVKKIFQAVKDIQKCSIQRGHRLDIEKLQEDIQKKKREVLIYDLQKQIAIIQRQVETIEGGRGVKRPYSPQVYR